MSTQCVLVLKKLVFVVNLGPQTVTKQIVLLLYFDEHTVCASLEKADFCSTYWT